MQEDIQKSILCKGCGIPLPDIQVHLGLGNQERNDWYRDGYCSFLCFEKNHAHRVVAQSVEQECYVDTPSKSPEYLSEGNGKQDHVGKSPKGDAVLSEFSFSTQSSYQLATDDTEWTVEEIKKLRAIYLVFYLLMIASNLAVFFMGAPGYCINFAMGILFLSRFNPIVKRVLGYSGGTLVGISLVILFIPLFSVITILIVDHKIYDTIRAKQTPSGEIKCHLSSLAVCSLVLCLFPLIGLPLAIVAVHKISKSDGHLYGKTLAWISVVINGLLLAMVLFCFIIGSMMPQG
jgi:hypothetical protein